MEIKASPTKEFFINMLTRDVPLDRSILDLIDNSVDAANSNSADGNLAGKVIEITTSADTFVIIDNCGGMARTDAEDHAFRFGRDPDAPPTPNSVGQFGVGMKRTLFKIGRRFEVKSHHPDGSFIVDVDVDEWLTDERPKWVFDLEECAIPGDNYGTTITVRRIPPNIGEQFELDVYINKLIEDIQKAHFRSISKGLEITVNKIPVEPFILDIKTSDTLGSVHQVKNINGVTVTFYAGIGERELSEGGWYIVCNGRLVVQAGQKESTGWSSGGIPKYHPDFAFFRGLIEFESEDSSLLPWTTTKSGVDVDNQVYRAALSDMRDITREFVSFLRDRAREAKQFEEKRIEDTPLQDAIDLAATREIFSIEEGNVFVAPEVAEIANTNPNVRVQYHVDKKRLAKVMEVSGLDHRSEAGLLAFDYFYEYEC